MGKFTLAFGIHNHQPIGNFQAVFEDAHQRSYQPFLSMLQNFPGIAISLHQSGILWRWQETAHPEYFQQVGELVDSGQVELMTGGFYEPILTAIPARDVHGQIKMLTSYLQDHFGSEPDGLWLTERIWEPHLPAVLAQAGVSYLSVDDTHFIYAGLEHEELTGPFVTEHEGQAVTLLPIQKKLRYLIPFGSVEEVIDELRRQAEGDPSGMAVYADDGEKFGVWPGTYELCFEKKWLEALFKAFEKNSDWLEIKPLGIVARRRPVGRAYLPSASYAEMLHWSLPHRAFIEYEKFEKHLKEAELDERFGRFVRGGHWRGFLTKYEESNLMHKKMLAVSDKLSRFQRENPKRHEEAAPARDRLYAGQCNCPYWHGVFGGIYLPHIRQAIWQALIEADHALNGLNAERKLKITEIDFDIDGRPEIVVESELLSAIFKPDRGGSLIHLAMNKHGFNLTDTLTRRREGYHGKLGSAVSSAENDRAASIHEVVLARESNLKEALVEDWYMKSCFIDHFFADDVDFEKFRSGKYGEEGDFILEPYQYCIDQDRKQIHFEREGRIWRTDGVVPIKVARSFLFDGSDEIRIVYEISTSHPYPVKVRFGLENNFSFQAGHADDRYLTVNDHRHKESFLDSCMSHEAVTCYAAIDEYRKLAVSLRCSIVSTLWHMPIMTVSMSEGGFERVYQGTTLVNLFQLEISDTPIRLEFSLYAGSSKSIPTGSLRTTNAGHLH